MDDRRIYAAGFSRGAVLTFALACQLASDLAAVATVGATLSPGAAAACNPSRPIPILLVQGTEDLAFPWRGYNGSYQLLSMRLTMEVWAELNGCSAEPDVEWLPDNEDDGTEVWLEDYPGCAGGAEVKLYAIAHGGHTWPSSPGPYPDGAGAISQEIGNAEIIEFLARHSLDE
ncbi:MAG: hypothetical protein JSV86_09220 [Gemmatimonadota bacterium]|nr:MAG: hypothetical protein JSV86_09220 [Gemmatimonadota bacterium]